MRRTSSEAQVDDVGFPIAPPGVFGLSLHVVVDEDHARLAAGDRTRAARVVPGAVPRPVAVGLQSPSLLPGLPLVKGDIGCHHRAEGATLARAGVGARVEPPGPAGPA